MIDKTKKLILSLSLMSFLLGILGGVFSVSVFFPYLLEYYIPEDNYKISLYEKQLSGVKDFNLEDNIVTEVVSKAEPAVVSIIATKEVKLRRQGLLFDDFLFDFPGLEFFFPQPPVQNDDEERKERVGAGTGFIVSEDGLILTNKHVVVDEEAEYTVFLNDGQKYEAKVLAKDPVLDLAVIKIEGDDFPVLELGDSDKIKIGQTVIAIGNTLGEFRNTVTKGVVSGVGRTVVASGADGYETIEEAIQTDAAINPGNSGGPLIDLNGKVIGINTAVSLRGQSVGFALPVNEAKRIIDSVEKYGKIVRPYLGVRYILINEQIAKANDLEYDYGALLVKGERVEDLAVVPGSPADKAGLEENDIILEVDGTKIDKGHSLARVLAKYQPGDTVKMKIYHDGDIKEIEVKLGEFKDD